MVNISGTIVEVCKICLFYLIDLLGHTGCYEMFLFMHIECYEIENNVYMCLVVLLLYFRKCLLFIITIDNILYCVSIVFYCIWQYFYYICQWFVLHDSVMILLYFNIIGGVFNMFYKFLLCSIYLTILLFCFAVFQNVKLLC